jgi:hypothetical protein
MSLHFSYRRKSLKWAGEQEMCFGWGDTGQAKGKVMFFQREEALGGFFLSIELGRIEVEGG